MPRHRGAMWAGMGFGCGDVVECVGFWHHSNTFRFAVVLFSLTEGESERERSGNPLPPPSPPANPPSYPSGLLAVGPPRRPMGDLTSFYVAKAQKVLLGLSEHSKTSYTYEKVRLGRFGSAEALQSAQNATLRS